MDMPFLKLVSYFVILTSFNLASSEVDIPIYYDHNCTIHNNFTSNSPYQFNLNTLLISLYSNATGTDTTAKFYNTTFGTPNINNDDADTVYGEYMCRGDVPMEVCQNCVQDATSRIASECPNNREAIIWYDQCFVRYSDRYFFSTLQQLATVASSLLLSGVDLGNAVSLITACAGDRSTPCGIPSQIGGASNEGAESGNSSLWESGYTELSQTLNNAVVEAATSTEKFETKEANLSSGASLYTLVQCTPDLSPQFCSQCLHGMMELIPMHNIAPRGRILNPSCNLRFDVGRFYYQGNQPPSFTYNEIGRPTLISYNCSPTKSFTANGPYLNNLRSLTHNLSMSSNITKNNGFYRTFVGNKSDTVYGLFMCRGDVPHELCHECVNQGMEELNFTCPSSKEAIIWYDMCMIRYSNRSFFSTLDTQPLYTEAGGDMLENQDGFNRLLANTLNDLVTATSNSVTVGAKNFAAKDEFSPSELKTLYALAQCTPNLNSQDCQKCLLDARQHITSCCLGRRGGQVMNPSCNLRFELYRFHSNKSAVSVPTAYPPNISGVVEPPTYPQFPKVSGNTGKHKDHSRTIIIAVSLAVVSIMLFGSGFWYWKGKKSRSYKAILKKNFGSEGTALESLQFSLATIEAATDKFSIENKIGKGGFGEVYKGILHDGSKIAVKRLSENSSQGLLEFQTEVLLIAKLQHRNLVALLGFCLKDQEKILVYEYVPNKSLDYFLFGSKSSRVLNWLECCKIIEGTARGILYLHEYSRLKAWKHWRDEKLRAILDSNLTEVGTSQSEIIKCIHVGLLCVQGNPQVRPSMSKVVQYLSNDSMQLPIPQEPAFFLHSQKEPAATSGALEAQPANNNQNSINEISESTLFPR